MNGSKYYLRINLKIILVIFLIINTISIPDSYSQVSITQAQSIFIYNFTRLIEWPADRKSGDFIIGVYGAEELLNDLKSYTSNKKVGGQSIKIEKINNPENTSGLHVIFVGFDKSRDISKIIKIVGEGSTLIICEKNGSLDQGADINFEIVEDKLKYRFSGPNIIKAGLKYNNSLELMSYH